MSITGCSSKSVIHSKLEYLENVCDIYVVVYHECIKEVHQILWTLVTSPQQSLHKGGHERWFHNREPQFMDCG